MSDSEETLSNQDSAVLKAIADLSAKIDIRFEAINQKLGAHDAQFEAINKKFEAVHKKLEEHDIQFEAIRIGIVANSAAFDWLQAKFFNLSADVKDLTEEVHQTRTAVMKETLVLEK